MYKHKSKHVLVDENNKIIIISSNKLIVLNECKRIFNNANTSAVA